MTMSDTQQTAFAEKPSRAMVKAWLEAIKKPPKRRRGPNKPKLADAVKHATKHGAELTVSPDGTMKFRPVSKANDNSKDDPTANPWDRVLHVKD